MILFGSYVQVFWVLVIGREVETEGERDGVVWGEPGRESNRNFSGSQNRVGL